MSHEISNRSHDAEESAVEFRLLGPVEAHSDGQRIDLGPPKQQLLLAILLTAGGRPVTTEYLIDQMWDEDQPEKARDEVHGYASDLRRRLAKGKAGAGELLPSHSAGGYRALAKRKHVDVHRFRDKLNDAQRQVRRDDAEAVRLFREALGQWGTEIGGLHGSEPLAGLTVRWAANFRLALQEEHRSALIACLEAELRLRRHDRLIPELVNLVSAGPPDERAAGLLMRAYYYAGRQADVTPIFLSTRQRLDEVAAVPSKDFERLYQLILSQDPSLELPASSHRPHGDVTDAVADASPGSSASQNAPAPSGATDPHAGQVSRPKVRNNFYGPVNASRSVFGISYNEE